MENKSILSQYIDELLLEIPAAENHDPLSKSGQDAVLERVEVDPSYLVRENEQYSRFLSQKPLYPNQAKILYGENNDLNRWCCMDILGIKVGIPEHYIAMVLKPEKVAEQTGNKLQTGVTISIHSRVITLHHLGELLFPQARAYLCQKTIDWKNLLVLKDLPVALGGGQISPWEAKDRKLLHWRTQLGGKRPWLLATSVKLNMILIDLEKLFQALDVNVGYPNNKPEHGM